MFQIALFWVLPGVLAVAVGALLSWLVVRWLPIGSQAKAIVYCMLFVALFTPLFIPITAAGVIVSPALGIGFLTAFWLSPFNFVLIGASIIFALLSARRIFLTKRAPEHA